MRCRLNYGNSIKNILFTRWTIIFHDKDNSLCSSWLHEGFALSQYQMFSLLSHQHPAAASGSCVQPSPAGVRTVLEIKSLPGEFCLQLELLFHPSSFPDFPVRNHVCLMLYMKRTLLIISLWRVPSLPPDLQWEYAQQSLVHLEAIKGGFYWYCRGTLLGILMSQGLIE